MGWGSGLHCCLIAIIPVAIVNTRYSPVVKGLLGDPAGLASLSSRACIAWGWACCFARPSHLWRPVEVHAPTLAWLLHHINQGATLLILGLLAALYHRVVHRAESRLQEPPARAGLHRPADPAGQPPLFHGGRPARGGRVPARRAPLAVAIGDVDHFKRSNDHHDHAAGDTALRAIARVLREGAREIDHVARWGGEEFLILLLATDGDEALSVCGRLREGVQGLSAQNVAGSDVGMSITLRVAVLQADEPIEQALLQPAVPCTKASKRAATVRFWRDRKPWPPYN
jgi:diguanylate cyclase (GGDEF)-like protein